MYRRAQAVIVNLVALVVVSDTVMGGPPFQGGGTDDLLPAELDPQGYM